MSTLDTSALAKPSHHTHVTGVHHDPHPGRSHLGSHCITTYSTEELSSTASQTAVAISLVSRSCTWTRRMKEDTAGGQTCSLLLNISTILASLERPSTFRGRCMWGRLGLGLTLPRGR